MSNRKSVLIVGVGSIGERHLRCFGATGRAELSLCDVNPALRQTVAQRYGTRHAFSRIEEALAEGPDAVVICTPAHLHVPLAIAAARAGAHLLIEKPLSTTLESIDVLRQETAKRALKVAVAYVYRAHPALAAMREAVRSGRFGEPVQVVAAFGQHFPHYRPAYRDTYYKERATGGGAVQDALTHALNAGEWLVGPITRLVADLDQQVLEGVTVEDTVHVLTRHDKVMGCFHLNQHQAPNEATLTVICRSGTARFEYHRNRWRWLTEPGQEWHDEPAGPLKRDALFVRQAESFLDTLDGLRPPLCTLGEAVQTLRVNLAIFESAARGGWEAISPMEAAHE
jgi:predicted dehydrogenase